MQEFFHGAGAIPYLDGSVVEEPNHTLYILALYIKQSQFYCILILK
jgi:hypothetical protein